MERSTKKRSRDLRSSSEVSDACHEVGKKSKNDKEMVDDTVDELRSKHGTKFTSLQCHVWAEPYSLVVMRV